MFTTTTSSMKQGKWYWNSSAKELHFEKTKSLLLLDVPIVKSSGSVESMYKEDPNTPVTLYEVKTVALRLVNPKLLDSMSAKSIRLFDLCYKTEVFDKFLWRILEYFQFYQQHQEISRNQALEDNDSVGNTVRKELELASNNLDQAKSNLGAVYISLISGMGIDFAHHTMQGRLRYSRWQLDQHLQEAIYEFAIFVTWITFNYDHWNTIHSVIGSLLRTTAFNKDLSVPCIKSKDEESDSEIYFKKENVPSEHLTWKIYSSRPSCGLLPRLRSPIFKVLYPPTEEVKLKTMLPKEELVFTHIGIIGQPKSNYDSKTLKFIVKDEDEEAARQSINGSDSLTAEVPIVHSNARDIMVDEDGIINDDNTDFDSDLF